MILFSAVLVGTMFVFALAWAFAKRVDNYGVVDAVWSLTFAVHALLFAFLAPGWESRRLLLAAIVTLWSLRLGLFLSKRIYSHHPTEDTRYRHLREEYGDRVPFRFFVFFQYQAVSVSLLTLPFFFIAQNPDVGFAPIEIVGAGLWLIALAGEAIADHQANSFKLANPGKVCRVGLWRFSRHPNYFFESVIWWAYFVLALGSPYGWTTLYAPLIMLFLLTKVTGIPPSEAQSLKSRGDAYRAYQREVSPFVPWFPKRSDS